MTTSRHSVIPALATGARSVAAAALLAGALSATAQECSRPDRPAVPDGSSASMEEMLEVQKAVKAFQSTNMAYMKCLERSFTEAKQLAASATSENTRAEAGSEYEEAVEAYNAAVSAEEEVASAFNVSLRAFKAASR